MSRIVTTAVRILLVFILYLGVDSVIQKISASAAGPVATVVTAVVSVFLGEFFFRYFKSAR
jgi:hypothetical protein